jgi:hypothetical protein
MQGLGPAQRVTPVPALVAASKSKVLASSEELKKLSAASLMPVEDVKSYLRAVRRERIRSNKEWKFMEAFWRALIYIVAFGFGAWSTMDKSWYQEPSTQCWEGWPYQSIPQETYQYYALELGVYVHLVLYMAIDIKRSDFMETCIHHLVTLFLIFFSWVMGFVRVGTLVMLVHDISDIPLETAKVVNYCKYNPKHKWWAAPAADGIFAVFAVTFYITRLYLYPKHILFNTLFYAKPQCEDFTWNMYYLFNGLLGTLQLLHIFWAGLITRMIYRQVVLNQLDDIRSDDEGGDDSWGEGEANGKEKKAK